MGIKSVLSREQLKDMTFERLGLQFRRVLMTEEQMDICIDLSLQKFFDEGDFGTEERFILLPVTANQQDYTMPYEVVSVVEVIETSNIMDFFSIERSVVESTILQRPGQLRLLDIEFTRQYLQEARRILVKKIPYDFNSITKVLHFQTVVKYTRNLVLRIYRTIDEEDTSIDFGNVYGHQWIKKYVYALAMIQFADNVAVYGDTPLPNNMKVNFQYYLDRGEKLREEAETELVEKYSAPPLFMIG